MTGIMIFALKHWRYLAGAAVLAFSALMVHAYGRSRYNAGAASVQAKWDAAAIKWNEETRKQEQVYAQAIEKAIAERDAKLKTVQADAAAARAAAGSLRDQLTETRRNLAAHSPAAVLDYANAASELLGECTAEYQSLGEKADGHAADAAALIRAWPGRMSNPNLVH
jgi:hypothetical protein